MIKPTSRNINIIAFVITIILFLIILVAENFWKARDRMELQISFNSPEVIQTTIEEENKSEKTDENKSTEENLEIQGDWWIEIPEINLKAEICEGTSKEVMNEFVGHFEETKLEKGNIGLAAHNRGYPVNYFQDLKDLKEGSEIVYKHGDFNMNYIVKTMEIIENTDWKFLMDTEDNRITLITCVENEPKYRRCIQGIEKIESEEF